MPAPETVWLTSGKVAALFGVNPKTVTRWADDHLIPVHLTPGGQRRFKEHEILPLLNKPVQT